MSQEERTPPTDIRTGSPGRRKELESDGNQEEQNAYDRLLS
jgi:hypothetical protein